MFQEGIPAAFFADASYEVHCGFLLLVGGSVQGKKLMGAFDSSDIRSEVCSRLWSRWSVLLRDGFLRRYSAISSAD